MIDLKNSETLKNLCIAFLGESQARNKYTFFATVANKEGYLLIENAFLEVAENERAHARIFYDLLVKNFGLFNLDVPITCRVEFGTTLENLLLSAKDEHLEWGTLYESFATKAKEEGFTDIYDAFTHILSIEKTHEERFLYLHSALKDNTLYKSELKSSWRCTNCGYIFEGTEVPKECPSCHQSQNKFKIIYDKHDY